MPATKENQDQETENNHELGGVQEKKEEEIEEVRETEEMKVLSCLRLASGVGSPTLRVEVVYLEVVVIRIPHQLHIQKK